MSLPKNQARTVISAKVRSEIVEELKKSEIPISRIVEACLTYYVNLPEEEQKKLLVENTLELRKLSHTLSGTGIAAASLTTSALSGLPAAGLARLLSMAITGAAINATSKAKQRSTQQSPKGGEDIDE